MGTIFPSSSAHQKEDAQHMYVRFGHEKSDERPFRVANIPNSCFGRRIAFQ